MHLNELRKELKFSRELVHLIETLKNIAAAQYHLLEKEKERFDLFMDSFSGFFRIVDLVEVRHPLVRVESDVLGMVVVTSDSGFMGGLNQGVMRAALEAQGDLPDSRFSMVVIGEKGQSAFSDMGRAFRFFPGINQDTIYEQAVEVKDYIVGEVMQRRMGRVVLAYPKPLSFSAQDIAVINILPCTDLFAGERAVKAAESAVSGLKIVANARKVIVESAFEDIVSYLAGTWVASKLFEVFEDSKLAEFSARAMHLEGSFQKLDEQLKKLKHQVSKAAHEKIDKGMRESFGAKKGLKGRQRRSEATAEVAE